MIQRTKCCATRAGGGPSEKAIFFHASIWISRIHSALGFFPRFFVCKAGDVHRGLNLRRIETSPFSHQQTRNGASEATHHGLNSPKSTHAASHLRTTFLSESEWSATSWRMNLFFMHQLFLLRIFSWQTWKLLAKLVSLSTHIDARNFY